MEPIDNFVEEIKEELRKDQILSFWNKYANLIIGSVIVIVLGTAGSLAYQSHRESVAEDEAKTYESALAALEQKDVAKAKVLLRDLIKSADDGYAVLGSMDDAQLTENSDEKAKLLLTLSKHKGVPELYRQIATYRYYEHILQGTAPQEFLKEIKDYLKPTFPLYASMKELQGLALLKANQLKEAAQVFGELVKDEKAPQGVRTRALALSEQLTR